jgi:hypothetical protein
MRRNLIGWWVMAAVLALSTPAVAHVSTSTPVELPPTTVEVLTAAAPTVDGLAALIAAVAITMLFVARSRRAVAVACMALLLVVAFEAGVHSVHHLTEPPGGQCVVASASAHIGGVAVTTIAFERPAEAVTAVAVTPTDAFTARLAAPDLGRAPPVV